MKETRRRFLFHHASQADAAQPTALPDWISRRWGTESQLRCLLVMVMLLASAATALSVNPPPGPYRLSCRNLSANGTTLTANCKDFFGNLRKTDISGYAACTGVFTDVDGNNHPLFIENIDGRLTCVISKGIRSGKFDRGSAFDVISMPQHFTRGNQEETVWRIDRPQVWSANRDGEVDYPMITFRPGDRLSFLAGGCVQTGGSGKTWKRYADPSGPNAEKYYWGTVSIFGVTLGTFQKIGLVEKQGAKVIPPAPQGAQPSNILKLGYLDDELDDNGYYAHDDGTDNQCKNEGPAWVQITVISGVAVAGPLWSPHSKPFDLVWNMASDEDENGLPINPQWNFSVENWNPKVDLAHWNPHVGQGAQPHFIPTCGAGFPSKPIGQYEIDYGILSRICTSMSYDFDLRPAGGGLCGGDPYPGHMNFGIATFQGQIAWGDWSGIPPQDEDWAFELTPRNGAGLAGTGDGNANASTLHAEFDIMEVLGLSLTPFWGDLVAKPFFPIGKPSSSIASTFAGPDGQGLEGVVIGVLGLDGVHGGFTEIHPLYAMAVRLEQNPIPGMVVEKWAFFLRNFGDEGMCSENIWRWDGSDFFIPLEWPDGATGDVTATPDVMRWQQAATPVGIETNKDQRFTLIHVQAPQGVDEFGVGGTLTLIYKVVDAPKQRKAPANLLAPSRNVEADTDMPDLGGRISDPAVRAKYVAAVNALPPMAAARPATALHVEVPAAVRERKHVAGAASRGKLIRARKVPNAAKIKSDGEMLKILQTYQKDLKIELAPVQMLAPALQAPEK